MTLIELPDGAAKRAAAAAVDVVAVAIPTLMLLVAAILPNAAAMKHCLLA